MRCWVAFVVLAAVCLNSDEVSASLTEASECTKARTISAAVCQDGLGEMCTVSLQKSTLYSLRLCHLSVFR